jgi:hypothetical protein
MKTGPVLNIPGKQKELKQINKNGWSVSSLLIACIEPKQGSFYAFSLKLCFYGSVPVTDEILHYSRSLS